MTDHLLKAKEYLADAKRRLAKLTAEGKPPDVLKQYDREVRRLEEWVAAGAPIPPLYDRSPDLPLDPLSARVYEYGFEGWPPQVVVTDEGPPIKIRVGALLMAKLANVLLNPPIHDAETKAYREAVRRGFDALRDSPPEGAGPFTDATDAKRWLLQQWVTEMIRRSSNLWEGRIGSGRGSGNVSGAPAASSRVAFERWLTQETLREVREWLRDHANLRQPFQEVFTRTGDIAQFADAQGTVEEIEFPEEDERLIPFARAWCKCDADERRAWLADLPDFFFRARQAVQRVSLTSEERAAFTLTVEEQKILESNLAGADIPQLAKATGVHWFSHARGRYIKKVAAALGTSPKQLRDLLSEYRRGKL